MFDFFLNSFHVFQTFLYNTVSQYMYTILYDTITHYCTQQSFCLDYVFTESYKKYLKLFIDTYR